MEANKQEARHLSVAVILFERPDVNCRAYCKVLSLGGANIAIVFACSAN